eukprot:379191-Pleurochrysis_carterae.AAC.1
MRSTTVGAVSSLGGNGLDKPAAEPESGAGNLSAGVIGAMPSIPEPIPLTSKDGHELPAPDVPPNVPPTGPLGMAQSQPKPRVEQEGKPALEPAPPPDPTPPIPIPPVPSGLRKWIPQIGDMCTIKGEGGYVWLVRANVGVVFNDARAPWQGFQLSADIAELGQQVNPPDHVSLLISGSDADSLPVQGVVLDKLGGGAESSRCPAGTLRGKWCGKNPAECTERCWDIFLAYMPGMEKNFAKPPVSITVSSGTLVACEPPFDTAAKGPNTAPISREVRVGTVLGVMFSDEEQWKVNKDPKVKVEQRRFVLVLFKGIDSPCFVAFEKVGLPTEEQRAAAGPGHAPVGVLGGMDACTDAGLVRKPGAVHQAYMQAVRELNQLNVNDDDGMGDKGKNGVCSDKPRTRRRSGRGGGGDGGTGEEGTEDAVPKTSGTPKRLANWGAGRLDTCTEAQLVLALTENKLSQPPAHVQNSSLDDVQSTHRFKHRSYKGYTEGKPNKGSCLAKKKMDNFAKGSKRAKLITVESSDGDDEE